LGKEFDKSPLLAMASILPASLLATPYSWSYDQILLIVPIVFSVLKIWAGWGNAKAVLFLIGIIASAIAFDVVAYLLNRDVWSVLVSAIVWISVLIFASRDRQGPALLQTTV
jgi:membrane-bound acyltransferase YfiQ involved in biofilm formation